jgi:hypothetical protein
MKKLGLLGSRPDRKSTANFIYIEREQPLVKCLGRNIEQLKTED